MAEFSGMVRCKMEIFTLIKANIRHKKGSFVSIILLMFVIAVAMISILSAQDNIHSGIGHAHDRLHTGNIVALINKKTLSADLLDRIKNHKLVEDATAGADTLISEKAVCKNTEYANNNIFLQEPTSGHRLFNKEKTGYLDETPTLRPGHCYIPQGLQTSLSCETGDSITFTTVSGNYTFTIDGIMEDPLLGASVIGWKNAYISHADYQKMYGEMEAASASDENICSIGVQFSIYKSPGCELTDGQFARQLNLDTGFSDMSFGTITREMSTHYTYLFPELICSILIVFVLLLILAVIVIICHSVSTGIEMEYTTLGILKSQGFSKGKIRVVLAAQYVIAEVTGILLSILPAFLLCSYINHIFQPITGIIPLDGISVGKCALILAGILLFSVVCMFVITGKVAAVSPVRAICGARREIYFDSRLKAPISRRFLSPSLALRQFTSNKRQYLGMLAVVTMLVFFMTTIMVLGNIINATSAWESMGISYYDVGLAFHETADDAVVSDIENEIRAYTGIKRFLHQCGNYYFSIDGEQIMCCIWDAPEEINAVSDGRAPLYDNEIVITEIAAENLGLEVGDTVTVGYRDKKADYIISGVNQYLNDAGVNISMTRNAAKKLNEACDIFYIGCVLSDRSEGEGLADFLNKKYGELFTAEYFENLMDETYQLAIHAMTAIVYVFSAIFSVIVVHMVCSKAFLRERRDIGIYKAVGFTSQRLRLQFMIRFLIVAVIGAAAGCGLAAAYSEKMLGSLLRMVGISSFRVPFHIFTFAIPVLMVCVCFCLFSFLEAGRIKKVEIRELITE